MAHLKFFVNRFVKELQLEEPNTLWNIPVVEHSTEAALQRDAEGFSRAWLLNMYFGLNISSMTILFKTVVQ